MSMTLKATSMTNDVFIDFFPREFEVGRRKILADSKVVVSILRADDHAECYRAYAAYFSALVSSPLESKAYMDCRERFNNWYSKFKPEEVTWEMV